VKFVVASAVDEEGNQIHPRVWNYEFIQLLLVIKEKSKPSHGHWAEISGLLNSLKERYAVLVALVAEGQGCESVRPSQCALLLGKAVWGVLDPSWTLKENGSGVEAPKPLYLN
jgi:hypothetical protein